MANSNTSRSRNPNMKSFEDEILCHSYVKISTNSIVGNSQPGATFWQLIQAEYNSYPQIIIERSAGSLQSRYSVISAQVMLYASKIAHAYANYQNSGTNEMLWIDRARDDFRQANEGKPFTFDSCYQILKELPKFNVGTTRMNTPQARFSDGNETSSPGTPTTPMGNINLGDDSPNDIEGPSERPMGRKGEKQRQKKKARTNSLASNTLILESCDKFNEQYTQNSIENRQSRMRFETQMKKLIQIRETEMEIKLRKEEDLIMSTDTSNMTARQQQYYEMRFDEIMRRRQQGSRGYSGPSSAPM